MKRLFLLIILVTTAAFVHGQIKHFSFLDVTLDGNTTDVFNQLIKKGFVPSEKEDLTLNGNFLEIRGASIKILENYRIKKVYGLKIKAPAPNVEVLNRINSYLQNYLSEEYKAEILPPYSNEYGIYFPFRGAKNGAEGLFVLHRENRDDEKYMELSIQDKANYLTLVYDNYIHVPFMDIPIDGTTAELKIKLLAKGFRFLGNHIEDNDIEEDNRYYMSFRGTFYGYENSTVNVFYHQTNNRVYGIEVAVPRNEEITKTVKRNLDIYINEAFEKYMTPPMELITEVNDQEKGIMKYRVFQPGSYKYAQPVVGYINIMADFEKRTVHVTYSDISSKDRTF